jgi:two-component system sporulation sensor kinase B
LTTGSCPNELLMIACRKNPHFALPLTTGSPAGLFEIEVQEEVTRQVLSILNHTIKNEMMKISACADMCKDTGLDEQQETYIDHIIASSEYLLGMTRRLQHHLNEIDVKLEEVNVSDMMNRIVKLNEPLCSPNGIRLETSIPDDSLMCQMDVIHVMEVVNSLIRNSIEAIQGKGRIILGLVDNRKTVMISVADDGQGITSIDLPYVMDPFYTTKRRTMNFGLGLTHGYNIMRQHKGYMEIASTEGKGTLVKLFFPHRTK